MKKRNEEYTCEYCGNTYDKIRSDEEALKARDRGESQSMWGYIDISERVLICEDCYSLSRQLVPMTDEINLTARPEGAKGKRLVDPEPLLARIKELEGAQMARPDFGWHETYHEGVKLTCRYVAPGLTMQDLMRIFKDAKKEADPTDHLSGNPSKWPDVRGINAVVNAILDAIYSK